MPRMKPPAPIATGCQRHSELRSHGPRLGGVAVPAGDAGAGPDKGGADWANATGAAEIERIASSDRRKDMIGIPLLMIVPG